MFDNVQREKRILKRMETCSNTATSTGDGILQRDSIVNGCGVIYRGILAGGLMVGYFVKGFKQF
jgi:hypothetical protein